IIETTGNGTHHRQRTIGTTTNGARYTFYAVLSSIGSGANQRHARLKTASSSGFGAQVDVFYDLLSGTSTKTTGPATMLHGIHDLGGGLWFCYFVVTATSVATEHLAIYSVVDSSTESFEGSTSAGLVVHHAQCEVGDGPTSPIINTGATANTRAADQIAWSGADLGTSDFTIAFRVVPTWPVPQGLAAEQTILDTRDDEGDDGLRIYNTQTDTIAEVFRGGVLQNDTQFSIVNGIPERWALILRCGVGNIYPLTRRLSDGTEYDYPVWHANGVPNAHAKLAIGQASGNAPMTIADLVVYSGALDDTQMDAVLDWMESRKDL